jgi:hypothetical protein
VFQEILSQLELLLFLLLRYDEAEYSEYSDSHGLEDRGLNPSRGNSFSLHHHVQTGSGAQLLPLKIDTTVPFPEL